MKLLWGTILAVVAGYRFNEAWEKEHTLCTKQSTSDKPVTKDTYVWTPPTTFLWVIVVIAGVLLIEFGFTGGTGIVIHSLLNLTVYFSVYFVILISLMPYLRRKISSRACATLWFCPIFMFYHFSSIGEDGFFGLFTIYVPHNILTVMLIVWLSGFAVSYIWSFTSHFIFRHRVLDEAYAVADETTLAIWKSVCKELEFSRPTALLISPRINSPLSMGRIKRTRCTILPVKAYSEDELRMIFLHEVHHLQRWDVDTKVFLTIVKCVCWFNPMVWIAIRKASQDLELSCDEIVIEKMTPEEKTAYAHLLLNSASEQRGFTTCLSASADALRYRLKNVVSSRSRKLGKFVIMLAVFISILCYNIISFADSRGTLKSFIAPEGTEMTYCPSVDWPSQLSPEGSDDCISEIDEILEGTIVEHYLNSSNIVLGSDEEPVCHLFINGPQEWNGSLLITFYDDYITISGAEKLWFRHREIYRIVKPADTYPSRIL